MSIADYIAAIAIVSGTLCFVAGTIGLLRLPDIFTRLHALTKIDNLGLGLIALGVLVQAESMDVAIKLLLVWMLVLIDSATTGHLVARHALRCREPNGGD